MSHPVSEVSQDCQEALAALQDKGFNFYTGVADSLLASLIEELDKEPGRYIPATREDLAIGLASGAYAAGKRPCVLMQNSGLGYCLNALTSLNLIYKIPVLLIVGYRGYQGKDAPEHWVMGKHCRALLEEIGIKVFEPEQGGMAQAIADADREMREKEIPAAILVRPGILTL